MSLRVVERIAERFRRDTGMDLQAGLILLGHVGSISHGTHMPDVIDDVDLMGVYVPPRSHLIGLGQWQHWTAQWEELDVVIYSLEKMVRLLLKQNPNVIGLLWLDDYVVATEAGFDLIARRGAFASTAAHASFCGYANGQLHKMEHWAFKGYMGEKRKALVERFGYDTKNASHLIRLLRMGAEFLATGHMQVRRPDAEELRAIKLGAWSLDEVKREADRLFAAAHAAKECSPLPDQPDVAAADQLVQQIHEDFLALSTWREGG